MEKIKHRNPDGKVVTIEIGAGCRIEAGCWIGTSCQIGAGCRIEKDCWIGAGCRIGEGCRIEEYCWIGMGCWILTSCQIGAGCRIEKDCWIGEGCQIGAGCRIEEDCRIGMGCRIGASCQIGAGCQIERGCIITSNRGLIYYKGVIVGNEYTQDYVRLGCEIHSMLEWERDFDKIADSHNTPTERRIIYKEFIRFVKRVQAISPLGTTLASAGGTVGTPWEDEKEY